LNQYYRHGKTKLGKQLYAAVCKKCKHPKMLAKQKRRYDRLRDQLISKYGGKCVHCGSTDRGSRAQRPNAKDRLLVVSAQRSERGRGQGWIMRMLRAPITDEFWLVCKDCFSRKRRSLDTGTDQLERG
jgi:RNase P subunit RPR2